MKKLSFKLDSNSYPYIIVESCINHNGDIKTALKDIAKNSILKWSDFRL